MEKTAAMQVKKRKAFSAVSVLYHDIAGSPISFY